MEAKEVWVCGRQGNRNLRLVLAGYSADSWLNYSFCPHFWRIVAQALGHPGYATFFRRLGLDSPSVEGLAHLKVAFDLYHSMKGDSQRLLALAAVGSRQALDDALLKLAVASARQLD